MSGIIPSKIFFSSRLFIKKINLDELDEKFCVMRPTFELYLKDETKKYLSVTDNSVSGSSAGGRQWTWYFARLLPFVLSISVCSVNVERDFRIIIGDTHAIRVAYTAGKVKLQSRLIINVLVRGFTHLCVMKKDALGTANSNEKHVFKFK